MKPSLFIFFLLLLPCAPSFSSPTSMPITNEVNKEKSIVFSTDDLQFFLFYNKNLRTNKIGHIGAFYKKKSNNWTVEAVIPGSSASKAGIKKGDLMLSVNEKPFHPMRHFQKKETANICYIRKRKTYCFNMKITHDTVIESVLNSIKKSYKTGKYQTFKYAYLNVWYACKFSAKILSDFLLKTEKIKINNMFIDLRGGYNQDFEPFIKLLIPLGKKEKVCYSNNKTICKIFTNSYDNCQNEISYAKSIKNDINKVAEFIIKNIKIEERFQKEGKALDIKKLILSNKLTSIYETILNSKVEVCNLHKQIANSIKKIKIILIIDKTTILSKKVITYILKKYNNFETIGTSSIGRAIHYKGRVFFKEGKKFIKLSPSMRIIHIENKQEIDINKEAIQPKIKIKHPKFTEEDVIITFFKKTIVKD